MPTPLPIRCLLVDDEPMALRVMQTLLAKVPGTEVVGACADAFSALEAVRLQPVDLIFLDIQMPELTGLEFVRALESPPRIIFTSAHRNYALEGFELDAVDYLLKPVSLPRLLRALDKYHRLTAQPHPASPPKADAPAFLSVRANRETLELRIDDIRFIESLNDYTKIHTSAHPILTRQRISHLEAALAPHGFLRIHRSFLVATAHLTAITTDTVQLGTVTLPISRSYKNTVRRFVDDAS